MPQIKDNSMIRKYQVSDTETIINVWLEASELAHPFLSEAFIEKEKENIRKVYLPNTETWVYQLSDEVVGFISMIGNEVGAIFLKPAFHGRGIGLQLMNQVAQLHDTLEVEVFEKNEIGRAFYKKYGFKEIKKHIHEETGFKLLRLKFG